MPVQESYTPTEYEWNTNDADSADKTGFNVLHTQ